MAKKKKEEEFYTFPEIIFYFAPKVEYKKKQWMEISNYAVKHSEYVGLFGEVNLEIHDNKDCIFWLRKPRFKILKKYKAGFIDSLKDEISIKMAFGCFFLHMVSEEGKTYFNDIEVMIKEKVTKDKKLETIEMVKKTKCPKCKKQYLERVSRIENKDGKEVKTVTFECPECDSDEWYSKKI